MLLSLLKVILKKKRIIMSAPVEWIVEDANPTPLPTIVSSTDLFDGELFGDELIDIYNSTVDSNPASGGKRIPTKVLSLVMNIMA